jgi:hypothetical protein
LVERLGGSEAAKARLALILEALAGRRTVAEVCEQLGLGERRLHALRQRALQAAVDSLEPRPAGRPAAAEAADARVVVLEGQVQELRLELRAAQIREEIALAMPHLLRRPRRAKKAPRPKARDPGKAGRDGGPGGCKRSARPATPAAERRAGAGPPGSG